MFRVGCVGEMAQDEGEHHPHPGPLRLFLAQDFIKTQKRLYQDFILSWYFYLILSWYFLFNFIRILFIKTQKRLIKTLLSRIDSCSVPGIYIKISPYHYLISFIEPHRFSYLHFSKQWLATIEENAKRSERRMRALKTLTKGPHFVSTSKKNTSAWYTTLLHLSLFNSIKLCISGTSCNNYCIM